MSDEIIVLQFFPEGEKRYRFEPNWVSRYLQVSTFELNALFEVEIFGYRLRYRFSPNSHSDWVCPHSWYRLNSAVGNPDASDYLRPLNSWILKDPVGFIPSEEDLVEETTWRRTLPKRFRVGRWQEATFQQVRAYYVREACREMVQYQRLLLEWSHVGRKQDQEEWSFGSPQNRATFRRNMKLQQKNVLEAKRKLEFLQQNHAPSFLTAYASGQLLQERQILDKMHEALLVCL